MKVIEGKIITRYMQEEIKEDLWEIYVPIIVELSNKDVLTIPVGFVTDFASSPKFLWSFGFPEIGKFNLAAILHDYFYTTHYLTKEQADKEFYEWMKFLTPGTEFKNACMYKAVKWFGGKRYEYNGNSKSERKDEPQ